MKTPLLACLALVPTLALLPGCGTTVTREDVNTVRDLSGNWNDTDSRLTAEHFSPKIVAGGWVDEYKAAHSGKKPVIKVGRVVVRTNGDVINTEIFTNDLVRALVNSGKVKAVGNSNDADQIRAERAEQDKNASEATRKESFQETGADFLLTGSINVADDQEGKEKIKFYSVDLKLVDITTAEQVWFDNHKIKKMVER
jgi:PBP1b-binding outer membrane lipoprotein LpoB